MYEKTKFLTPEELEALRQQDIKRSSSVNYIACKDRENYYSPKRKTVQRTLNFHVRRCNRIIREDYLWRERFFIRQVGCPHFHRFEDGSGGELFVTLRFYDKKTLKYIDSFSTASDFCFGWGSVYWLMNKAITEKFDVWKKEDEDSPRNDNVDYTSIPNDWVVKNAEPLYEEYNYFHH